MNVSTVDHETYDSYNNEDNFQGGVNFKHLFFSDPIQNSIIHDSYFNGYYPSFCGSIQTG